MYNQIMVRFTKMQAETSKAILVKIFHEEYWFPKRFCRNFTLNKKLGGHITIPEWLYREKFNADPPEEDVVFKVEKHVPEKIDPIADNTIQKLKK